jgi:hypothetical protein
MKDTLTSCNDNATETLEVSPSPKPRHVVNAKGETLAVPDAWELLEPGDAALSRRIKKDGPTWTMNEKKRSAAFFKRYLGTCG